MAWDIVKNILFVGILYMVVPYLIVAAIWAQVMKMRSDRDSAGRRKPDDED
jgi:hypothetical protein